MAIFGSTWIWNLMWRPQSGFLVFMLLQTKLLESFPTNANLQVNIRRFFSAFFFEVRTPHVIINETCDVHLIFQFFQSRQLINGCVCTNSSEAEELCRSIWLEYYPIDLLVISQEYNHEIRCWWYANMWNKWKNSLKNCDQKWLTEAVPMEASLKLEIGESDVWVSCLQTFWKASILQGKAHSLAYQSGMQDLIRTS